MSLPNFNQMNPFFGSLEDLLSPVTFASTPPANSPPELTFADLESILNNSNSPPFGITTASGPVFPFPETADDFNFNFGSESPDPTDFFETILSRPLPNSPHSNSPHPSPSMTDSASEPEGSKKVVPGKRGRKKKELTLEQQEEKSKERLMKNREAAQQSRDKKRKYMDDLESTNLTLAKRLVTLETQNQTLLTRLEEMAMQMTEMRGLMQGSSRGIGSGRDDRKFISNLADSTNQSSKS
ncbi:hypothetical protein BC829DRAFT_274947 [Chytridium lagenaria]|nr:hypothetical protein BC829DRAFT_274947 [Chytridium lagenaria]